MAQTPSLSVIEWGREAFDSGKELERFFASPGLTDDERASFDANFPALNELLNSVFEDWDANRGRFDDAGAAETMEALMADETAQLSWDTLSAHTWTLGNSEDWSRDYHDLINN